MLSKNKHIIKNMTAYMLYKVRWRRNEFAHAAGCGRRLGIAIFGSGAISNCEPRKQQTNHWYLSRFHAWLQPFYERVNQIHSSSSNEYIDDVSTSRREFIHLGKEIHYQFRPFIANPTSNESSLQDKIVWRWRRFKNIE